MQSKVALALSDGVDSAVAGYLLLQAGYQVEGLYLDIAGAKERADAEASAKLLGIHLTVRDITARRETFVCRPFLEDYRAGLTPNPCTLCNPRVKLPVLMEFAKEVAAEHIATGHYVRTDGQRLYTGQPDEDQSYMLCRLSPEQVRPLLLPLGTMKKREAREIAAGLGLAVADKPDSRENCFIRGEHYTEWLMRRGLVKVPGPVRFGEEIIGRHEGLFCYTVGQRFGETPEGRRLYVSALDVAHNEVRVCLWEDLFTCCLRVAQLSWLESVPAQKPFSAVIRVRHTRWEMPACTVTVMGDEAFVVTETPLRAPAPGQTAAFYRGDQLLGGGVVKI